MRSALTPLLLSCVLVLAACVPAVPSATEAPEQSPAATGPSASPTLEAEAANVDCTAFAAWQGSPSTALETWGPGAALWDRITPECIVDVRSGKEVWALLPADGETVHELLHSAGFEVDPNVSEDISLVPHLLPNGTRVLEAFRMDEELGDDPVLAAVGVSPETHSVWYLFELD